MARLRRPWFAGGTVEYVSVQTPAHQLRVGAEAFDGAHGLGGIVRLSRDGEVGFEIDERRQSCAEDGMVVHDEDALFSWGGGF